MENAKEQSDAPHTTDEESAVIVAAVDTSPGGSRVVEIASNDGYLLRNFVEAGVPALGVEPAANVAAVLYRNG